MSRFLRFPILKVDGSYQKVDFLDFQGEFVFVFV